MLLLVVGTASCARAGGQPFQPTLNTALVLDEGDLVGQTTNPNGPVAGVDLSVGTFDEPADPEGTLTVTIREVGTPTGEVLARAQVPGADLVDGGWAAARFDEPVEVDGVALLEVRWAGTAPIALWANTTQPATRRIHNDPYAAGQMVLDGRPAQGDLAFRLVGPGGATPALRQVGEVLRSTGARLADQPLFTVLWALALAGAAALALRGLGPGR